jgi:hypothetical protein
LSVCGDLVSLFNTCLAKHTSRAAPLLLASYPHGRALTGLFGGRSRPPSRCCPPLVCAVLLHASLLYWPHQHHCKVIGLLTNIPEKLQATLTRPLSHASLPARPLSPSEAESRRARGLLTPSPGCAPLPSFAASSCAFVARALVAVQSTRPGPPAIPHTATAPHGRPHGVGMRSAGECVPDTTLDSCAYRFKWLVRGLSPP